MPRHCAAYGCTNNALKQSCKKRNISFHRFPLNDDALLKRWLIQIQRQDFTPSIYSTLCSEHFNEDDFSYQPFTNRREIKKHAVPSIFPHKSSVKTKRTSCQIDAPVALKNESDAEPVTENASCLVLGCDSGYNSKRNEIPGQRNASVFIPSKNNQSFEKWKRMVPRSDIILSSKDCVYKLRFEKGCSETDYIIKLPDGTTHKIPRNALKKGTAPISFPKESSDQPMKTNKRKASTGFFKDMLKKLDGKESDEFDMLQQSNDFFKLSTQAKNALTPNSLWSVVCTEEFIIFAKWNLKYSSERRVVIHKDLSTKIFLKNVEVSLSSEECTIGNLSQLLQKVDDFIICKNADSGTSGCLGFVRDKSHEFCFTCCIFIKIEKAYQRRSAQNLVDEKERKSVCQVENINKRNKYLKKTILDLNKELIESKHQSFLSKEDFLEAISDLPTDQQMAITTCHSFKSWF